VSEPTWNLSMNKAAGRAHAAWLARGRTGDGRLVIEDENLQGAEAPFDLRGARFVRCDLGGCRFEQMTLHDLELVDCVVHAGVLHTSSFNNARFERTSFRGADLRMTRAPGLRMAGGDLAAARLDNAIWAKAELRGVDLRGARLVDTVFDDTVFVDCDLRDVDLRREDLALELGHAARAGWR
jgi:uncharacterized protein YjbI with pentapeptide repeats